MKALKLVYFAHGWYLALSKQPLILDPVEAWQYGPVIPSLYRGLKSYGSRPVTELLPTGDEPQTVPSEDQGTQALLERVWKAYGHLSALRLSDITHMPGTPWHDLVQKKYNGRVPSGLDIDNHLIREYFENIRQRTAHGG